MTFKFLFQKVLIRNSCTLQEREENFFCRPWIASSWSYQSLLAVCRLMQQTRVIVEKLLHSNPGIFVAGIRLPELSQNPSTEVQPGVKWISTDFIPVWNLDFFFSHLRSKDERKESAKKRTADIRPAHLALNLSLRFFWITVFDVRSSKIPTSPPLICRLSCFYPGHSCSVVIRQRPPGICLITVWRYVCQQVAPPPLLQPSFSWSAVSFDGCDPAGSRKEVSVWKWKAVSATLRICCDGEDDCNSLRDFFQGIHQLRCRWYGLYQSEMKDVSDILSTLLPPLPHWPGSQRQVMMYSSGD